MGLFDGVGGAEVQERGTFLPEGTYKLKVEKCLTKNTTKAGMAYIAEMTVLESTVPSIVPGLKVTYFQKLSGEAWLPGRGTLKAFACACVKRDPKTLSEEEQKQIERVIEASINDNPALGAVQPFAGRIIVDTVVMSTTKPKTVLGANGVPTVIPGHPVSIHNFRMCA